MSTELEEAIARLLAQKADRQKLAKAIARLIKEEEVSRQSEERRRRYQVPRS